MLLPAYLTAKDALPEYAHRFSPKKFTQHQLFAGLALKAFHNTDYRGIVANRVRRSDTSRGEGIAIGRWCNGCCSWCAVIRGTGIAGSGRC